MRKEGPVTQGMRNVIGASAAILVVTSAPASATVYQVADDGAVLVAKNGSFDRQDIAGAQAVDAAVPEAAPDVPANAITTLAAPSVPEYFRQSLLDASERNDLSPRLLAALARQESAWRPSIVSPKGAVGLTQLMPATARALAVDPRDPSANLHGGARYLRSLIDRFDGDLERALAAYNAGPARVARTGGVPAIRETRAYVATIVDRLGGAAAGEGAR